MTFNSFDGAESTFDEEGDRDSATTGFVLGFFGFGSELESSALRLRGGFGLASLSASSFEGGLGGRILIARGLLRFR